MADQKENVQSVANGGGEGAAEPAAGFGVPVKRPLPEDFIVPETPAKRIRLDLDAEKVTVPATPEGRKEGAGDEKDDEDEGDVVEPSPCAVRLKPSEINRYHSSLVSSSKARLEEEEDLDEARLLGEDGEEDEGDTTDVAPAIELVDDL